MESSSDQETVQNRLVWRRRLVRYDFFNISIFRRLSTVMFHVSQRVGFAPVFPAAGRISGRHLASLVIRIRGSPAIYDDAAKHKFRCSCAMTAASDYLFMPVARP